MVEKKVLVIDDDLDILDAIQLMLESEGYDAKTTTKGDDALNLAESYQPDAIILDVFLSGRDGREICMNLKQQHATKHIPVLMISAHPRARDSVKACGADAFIAKPFSIEELLNQTGKLTDQSEAS